MGNPLRLHRSEESFITVPHLETLLTAVAKCIGLNDVFGRSPEGDIHLDWSSSSNPAIHPMQEIRQGLVNDRFKLAHTLLREVWIEHSSAPAMQIVVSGGKH
jgi:hypothetical protein